MKNNKCVYSKAFYSEKVLTAAISDYKRLAKIKMFEYDGCFICEFCKCAVDSQAVINEFNNYLIELLNSRGENASI